MSQADLVAGALNPGGALKTPAAAPLWAPPVVTAGLTLSREDLSLTETAGSRAPSAREYGGRIYEGDVEGAARPDSFPFFLSLMFGNPTTTTVLAPVAGPPAVPGVYRHVWNPAPTTALPTPGTLWTVNNDVSPAIVNKYVGVKGNELSLEVEANGYVRFTNGLVAYDLDRTAAAPSITKDTTPKWVFHQVTAELAVAAGALASVPLLGFSWSFNNNLVTDQFVLGSKQVDSVPNGNIESETTFTAGSAIESHYARSLLDTPEDVRLKLTALGNIITATHRYTLEVDLKRLQYAEAPVSINADETLRGVEVTANPVLTDANDLLTVAIVNTYDGTNYRI